MFSDICHSIKINREEAFLDQSLKFDKGAVLSSKHEDPQSLVPESSGGSYASVAQDFDASDDLDWFFNDDEVDLTGSTAKSVVCCNEDAPAINSHIESDSYGSNYSYRNLVDSNWNKKPYCAVSADFSGAGVGTRIPLGNNDCDEVVKSISDDDHDNSEKCLLSDAWLAYGLQHSFKWEFELNSARNTDSNCAAKSEVRSSCSQCSKNYPLSQDALSEYDVSLPMRLAIIAAESLWGEEKSGKVCDHCAAHSTGRGSEHGREGSLTGQAHVQGECECSSCCDAANKYDCNHSGYGKSAGHVVTERVQDM